MLASTLKGAVSQRLVPTADGVGRVAASEILVVTGRVQDLILNPTETGKISQVIAEGEYYGMQTFDQSLLKHVSEGRVAEEVAMEFATSPHDFKLMLASAGKRASDLSQLFEDEDEDGEGDDDVVGSDPVPVPDASDPPDPPPDPDAAPDPDPAPDPDAQPGEAHVDYGSPEHAYGRSTTPQRPVPDAPPPSADQPVPAAQVEPSPTDPPPPSPERGEPSDPDADSAPGLGGEEYSSIWEQDSDPSAPPSPPPASKPGRAEDRLAEFRPPPRSAD